MDYKKAKNIVKLLIALLTAIASFLGGQASAENGIIDIFNKQIKTVQK